ncbi:hypothetical protein IFO69_19305 [Echinicola sp. CAU 1574]|uniref:Capsule assembly protein Wzi n=1 Tax=Echinicola arenosa TaxID=2774144 RepID=A0ABR9ATG3_9BACT|nr:capsule assembly Wzi family protein [Echinicola arenosa]MBD8490909.1 hypothetical protein [Echinicola arenosa]
MLVDIFNRYFAEFFLGRQAVWAIIASLFLGGAIEAFGQNLPLNMPVYQDYLRRQQILDTTNSELSFNIRPFYLDKIEEGKYKSLMLPEDFYQPKERKSFTYHIMPLQLTHLFNSNFPYGWGNGAGISGKGQEFLLSAGVRMKVGPMSIQLYPQLHYTQNLPFEEYPEDAPESFFRRLERSADGIDLPVRYGDDPISKFLSGNSHVKIMFGSFAAGVSTENIWWGPAKNNALLIGDNAQGFAHATIHSTRPVKTFLGSFEGQYFIGRLDGSGFGKFSDGAYSNIIDDIDEDDWRYLTGITISYSPKWLPGLSVGGSRTFQIYRNDMGTGLRSWVPLFSPLPKDGEGVLENVYKREDQGLEVYFRWAVPKAHSEVYFEFMRADHAFNWRDVMLNPEHSRGYVIGASKYMPMGGETFLGISLEMTQTQNSINNIIRWRGEPNRGRGLYDNYQVLHGLTNRGQVLGAGLGTSGNIQILELSWVEGLSKVAVQLERYARDQNFYQYANSNGEEVAPWIDFATGFKLENRLGNLLFQGHLRYVKSFNYNFYAPDFNEKLDRNVGKSVSNFNSNIKVAYIF